MVVLLHAVGQRAFRPCCTLRYFVRGGYFGTNLWPVHRGFCDRGHADHPSLLDSLPQRLPQCSFAGDAMRAKFALCPGLLSPTEPGKSGRYMNQEDGVPVSFVHSIFLTYPRDRAYVAANRSPIASILDIIRAGRVPKQKTRLVRALWQMFQDI